MTTITSPREAHKAYGAIYGLPHLDITGKRTPEFLAFLAGWLLATADLIEDGIQRALDDQEIPEGSIQNVGYRACGRAILPASLPIGSRVALTPALAYLSKYGQIGFPGNRMAFKHGFEYGVAGEKLRISDSTDEDFMAGYQRGKLALDRDQIVLDTDEGRKDEPIVITLVPDMDFTDEEELDGSTDDA